MNEKSKKIKLKTIEEFPNYQISSEGKVWSNARTVKYLRRGKEMRANIRGRWLKPYKGIWGYLKVTLCKDGKNTDMKIHRLVAQAFIPNPMNKPQINHLSGIKIDNRVENLEFCTSQENMDHAIKNGLFNNRGENAGRAKLTWEQVNEIRENHNKIRPYKIKIWEKYGIGATQYYRIKNNECWYDSKYKRRLTHA